MSSKLFENFKNSFNNKARNTTTILTLCTLSFLAASFFTGCENFLNSESVKQEIISAIDYNNAPSYSIHVEELEGSGQVKTPVSGVADKKVGDTFTIKFVPTSDHTFIRWEALIGDLKQGETTEDYIHFEDAENLETKVTLKKASSDIKIQPVCPEKLKVSFNASDATTVYPRDTTIQLTFNKPLAQECKDKVNLGIPEIPEDRTALSYFKEPELTGNKLSLFADVSQNDYSNLIPVTVSGKTISVVLKTEDFYYVNELYSKPEKIYLENDVIFTYAINTTTSNKTKFKFILPDDISGAGLFRIDEENISTKDYSVSQIINLKYNLTNIDDYIFKGWSFKYAPNIEAESTPVAIDQLNSLNIGIFYDSNDQNYGYDSVTHTAQASVKIYNYKDGVISISPVVEPIPQIQIKIDGNHGKLSPSRGLYPIHVGETNTVSFEPDSDYEFIHWQVYDEKTNQPFNYTDYLTIVLKNNETDYELLRRLPNNVELGLRPIVKERPKIISSNPIYISEGAFRDSRIQVMFDREMDVNSIYFTDDEITELRKKVKIPDDKFLPEFVENDTTRKYYGYEKDGDIIYKNITIINNKNLTTNLLQYFDAPRFEDARKLAIPTKKGHEPPSGTALLVTIGKNFSYQYKDGLDTKDITMSESHRWVYWVNANVDNKDGPVISADQTEIRSCSTGDLIPTNSSVDPVFLNGAKKIKVRLSAVDPGSGPEDYFEMKLYYASDNITTATPIRTIPIYYETVEGMYAICGNALDDVADADKTYMECVLDNFPDEDGDYKFTLTFYDKNGNQTLLTKTVGSQTVTVEYYVSLDTTNPTLSTRNLVTGNNSSKTEIKFTYKSDDTDYRGGKLYYRQAVPKTDSAWTDWSEVDYKTLERGNSTKDVTINNLDYSTTYELKAVIVDRANNEQSYLFKKETNPEVFPRQVVCEKNEVNRVMTIKTNGFSPDSDSVVITRMTSLNNSGVETELSNPSSVSANTFVKKDMGYASRYKLYLKGTKNEVISDSDYDNNGKSYTNVTTGETPEILTKPYGVELFYPESQNQLYVSSINYDGSANNLKFTLRGYDWGENDCGVKISYASYNSNGTLGSYSTPVVYQTWNSENYNNFNFPCTNLDAQTTYNFKFQTYFYDQSNVCSDGNTQYIDIRLMDYYSSSDGLPAVQSVTATQSGEFVNLSWTPPAETVDFDHYLVRITKGSSYMFENTLSTIVIDKNVTSCLIALSESDRAFSSSDKLFFWVSLVKGSLSSAEKYNTDGLAYSEATASASYSSSSSSVYSITITDITDVDFGSANIHWKNTSSSSFSNVKLFFSENYSDLPNSSTNNISYGTMGAGASGIQNVSTNLTGSAINYCVFISVDNKFNRTQLSEIFAIITKPLSSGKYCENFKAEIDENNPNKVNLSWTAPSSCRGLTFSYRKRGEADWSDEVTLTETDTSHEVILTDTNTTYEFRLRSKQKTRSGDEYYCTYTEKFVSTPVPVSIIPTTTETGENTTTLSWVNNSNDTVDHYRIYDKENKMLIGNISGTATSLIVTGMKQSREIFMQACNASGSAIQKSDTIDLKARTLAVRSFQVNRNWNNHDTVSLSHASPYSSSTSGISYDYYYKLSSSSEWSGPVTNKTISGLTPTEKYDFKVITKKTGCEDSAPVYASAQLYPNTVTVSETAATTPTSITVNWTNPTGNYYKTILKYTSNSWAFSNNDIEKYWQDAIVIYSTDLDKPVSYTFDNLSPETEYCFRWETVASPDMTYSERTRVTKYLWTTAQ